MSSSSLVTLGLGGVLAAVLLSNFDTYEKMVPGWYFQVAFIFDIYYQYAMKSKDLAIGAPKFFAISLIKRYHKFIILSVLYFGKIIRDMGLFNHILHVFMVTGAVFYAVPLKYWTYLMEKILPFRLIFNITNFVFIGADERFMYSVTIGSPNKLAIFSNPAVEYIFISFLMGTLAPLIDNALAPINLSKKVPLFKVIQSSCNWGFSGVLAYLVNEHFDVNIFPFMASYNILPLCDKMEFIRRAHLLFFCLLGGFYSKTASAPVPAVGQNEAKKGSNQKESAKAVETATPGNSSNKSKVSENKHPHNEQKKHK